MHFKYFIILYNNKHISNFLSFWISPCWMTVTAVTISAKYKWSTVTAGLTILAFSNNRVHPVGQPAIALNSKFTTRHCPLSFYVTHPRQFLGRPLCAYRYVCACPAMFEVLGPLRNNVMCIHVIAKCMDDGSENYLMIYISTKAPWKHHVC